MQFKSDPIFCIRCKIHSKKKKKIFIYRSEKKKKKVNKFLHLFLSTNTKNPSTVRKTRFLESRRKRKRKKIIDNEFVNYPNANSSRRCIIIKSDIGDNLEVKPFRAIILSRWYLHTVSRPGREISAESWNRREDGKYTRVKSLFAPGPQAFQLLLTINVQRKGRCAFKAWLTGAESSLETIPLFHQKEF